MFGPHFVHVHDVEGVLHSPKRIVGVANVALRSEHEDVPAILVVVNAKMAPKRG
jgi:hypothetical protein